MKIRGLLGAHFTKPVKKRLATLVTPLLLVTLAGCDTAEHKARIALGPENSASHHVSLRLLDAYHLTEHDVSAQEGRFEEALNGIQTGSTDIAMGFFGLPSRNVDSLQAATGDLNLLSVSDAVLADFEKNTGYRRFTIPKKSYLFLEQDVTTLAAFAVLMANTQTVSDELAYQLAKVMYQQGSSIAHSQAPFLALEHALEGAEGLRIHPGAKRFYEEQGLTVNLPVAELNLVINKQEFMLGSGSQGGTYYPLGGELASRWNQFIPSINITSVATDASLENLSSLAEGKLDLSMTVNISALDAQAGTGHFANTAVDNAAFIGQLYPEVFHIITRASNPISSFSEIPISQ
ncbi:TAXI family TRAP transporter solute-binding subunit [Oceanisphaera sp. W20_SRM_FM3]|uniref:TAXI family TRAP transporter solute-binding subunit n=1 Tax=Oceanisphaera sp. W20_SRM_FM3 TaxID=3240267 RepID=UPI003F97DAE2